jgi:hypothetical protein
MAGGIYALETIAGLHKRLKIRAQQSFCAVPHTIEG